jgi:hypothetical protein
MLNSRYGAEFALKLAEPTQPALEEFQRDCRGKIQVLMKRIDQKRNNGGRLVKSPDGLKTLKQPHSKIWHIMTSRKPHPSSTFREQSEPLQNKLYRIRLTSFQSLRPFEFRQGEHGLISLPNRITGRERFECESFTRRQIQKPLAATREKGEKPPHRHPSEAICSGSTFPPTPTVPHSEAAHKFVCLTSWPFQF